MVLHSVTLSNVIPLCTTRGGFSQQSQQCFSTGSEEMSDSELRHSKVQLQDTKAECITEHNLPATNKFLSYTL